MFDIAMPCVALKNHHLLSTLQQWASTASLSEFQFIFSLYNITFGIRVISRYRGKMILYGDPLEVLAVCVLWFMIVYTPKQSHNQCGGDAIFSKSVPSDVFCLSKPRQTVDYWDNHSHTHRGDTSETAIIVLPIYIHYGLQGEQLLGNRVKWQSVSSYPFWIALLGLFIPTCAQWMCFILLLRAVCVRQQNGVIFCPNYWFAPITSFKVGCLQLPNGP